MKFDIIQENAFIAPLGILHFNLEDRCRLEDQFYMSPVGLESTTGSWLQG